MNDVVCLELETTLQRGDVCVWNRRTNEVSFERSYSPINFKPEQVGMKDEYYDEGPFREAAGRASASCGFGLRNHSDDGIHLKLSFE